MSFADIKSYLSSCGQFGTTAQWCLELFDIDLADAYNNFGNVDTTNLSLSLIEFIEFYHKQYARRDEIWNDMCCQGYSDTLREEFIGDDMECIDVFEEDICWETHHYTLGCTGKWRKINITDTEVVFDVVSDNNITKAINVTHPINSYGYPYVQWK